MRSSGLSLLAIGLLAAGALSFACSSLADSSAFADRETGGNGSESPGSATGTGDFRDAAAGAPDLLPSDNGIIMVHAAGMPAFRLCFESDLDLRPMPDRNVMPDANVVGVEVGTAVRIPPLSGAPGRIWIFPEPAIRSLTGQGDTCRLLLDTGPAQYAYEMPAVTTDLSHGVHLLVVRGCKGKGLTTYTKEECGEDYDENKPAGNLSILEAELKGALRGPGELPTQVIHLSRAIETARKDATLSVSFGDIQNAGTTHTSIASAPVLFGAPLSLTKSPSFDEADAAVYDNVGFRVKLTSPEGGAPTVLAEESLASIQSQSAPREIPSTYYSAASNYVLLLLGSPDPKLPDGGADDDPFRKVHLLAVPVIEPKAAPDGGEANDGGSPDGAL